MNPGSRRQTADELFKVGCRLHRGEGVGKDLAAAKALFERAVEAGNVGAMVNLAEILTHGGGGVAKDARAARALYERAIDAGNATALIGLASLLKNGGNGVPKDILAAKELYERAIDAGNADALNGLANLLKSGGEGVPKDARMAKELYEYAIEKGNAKALNGLANLRISGGDGVSKDARAAKELYERAIEVGNVDALNNLANLLRNGSDGVPKDARRAMELYERAIDSGNVSALNGLASLLIAGGDGVSKDASRAKELYERAIDAGYVLAMQNLADLLCHGAEGVTKDLLAAKALYKQAVDAGSVSAQNTLASLPTDDTDPIPSPSPLELAFGTILADPSLLDELFIVKHLVAENVKSVSDLVSGHNVVLLSIRGGIITRENIRSIGGSSWYLQDNLYMPGSKLITENAAMIDAVLQHAENLGIISHGYVLKVAREVRTEMRKGREEIGRCVEGLADRVGIIERRVSRLEGNVEKIRSDLKKLCTNQGKLKVAVASLSNSLTQLQKLIRKNNRQKTYAAVARCVLSFIPVVGSAVGNAAYSATEVLLNMKMEDVVSAGVDAAKGTVSLCVKVDLSNFQVARYAFSNKCINELDVFARGAVTEAVCASGFKSLSNLREALEEYMASIGHADMSSAFVDMGCDLWLSKSDEQGGGSGSSNHIRILEEKARKYFQSLTITNEHGVVSIEEAKAEMNRFLSRCEGLSEMSDEKLEDVFFHVAEEDVDTVDEDIFARMFGEIAERQEKDSEGERFATFCLERFRHRAGGKSLSIRMAGRVLTKLSKDLQNDEIMGNICRVVTAVEAEEELKMRDVDGSGTIDESEFLNTAREVLLG